MGIVSTRKLFLGILSILFLSCERGGVVQEISDGFYTINPYWDTSETNGSKSFEIVVDPINKKNNAMMFRLSSNDFIAGGKRNEFVLKSKDTIGLEVNYSFNFLLTPGFFSKKHTQDWIMIHQWHDKPPKGINWTMYNMKTRPPVHLYIQVNPDNKFYVVYAYGLSDKNKNDLKHIKFEKPIEPNTWYSFENSIYWNTNETGYSVPKINDEYLVKKTENKENKIVGANMFNEVPNYFKVGLYGNYKSNSTVSILIDEFSYLLSQKNLNE